MICNGSSFTHCCLNNLTNFDCTVRDQKEEGRKEEARRGESEKCRRPSTSRKHCDLNRKNYLIFFFFLFSLSSLYSLHSIHSFHHSTPDDDDDNDDSTHKTTAAPSTAKRKAKSSSLAQASEVDAMVATALLATPDTRSSDTGRRDSLLEFGFVELANDAAPDTAPAKPSKKSRSSSLRHLATTKSALTAARAAALVDSAPDTAASSVVAHRRRRDRADSAGFKTPPAVSPRDDASNDESTSAAAPADDRNPSVASLLSADDEVTPATPTKKKTSPTRTAVLAAAATLPGRRRGSRRATVIGAVVPHNDGDAATADTTTTTTAAAAAAATAAAAIVGSPRAGDVSAAEAKVEEAQAKVAGAAELRSSLTLQLESHHSMLKAKKLSSTEKARVETMLRNLTAENDALSARIAEAQKELEASEAALARARTKVRRAGSTVAGKPIVTDEVRQSILSAAEARAAARRSRKEPPVRSGSKSSRRASDDGDARARRASDAKSAPTSPVSAEKAAALAAMGGSGGGSSRRKKKTPTSPTASALPPPPLPADAGKVKSPNPSPRWQPGQRISMSLFVQAGAGDDGVATTIYRVGTETRKGGSDAAGGDDSSSSSSASSASSNGAKKRRAPEVKFSAAPEVPMTPRALARQEAQALPPPPPLPIEFSLNALLTPEAQEQASKRASAHLARINSPSTIFATAAPPAVAAFDNVPKSRLSVMLIQPDNGDSSVQVCSICEDDARWPAALKCYQCQLFYCTECVKFAHPDRGLLKHHVLLPLDNQPPPEPPSIDVPDEAPPIVDEPPPIVGESPVASDAPAVAVAVAVADVVDAGSDSGDGTDGTVDDDDDDNEDMKSCASASGGTASDDEAADDEAADDEAFATPRTLPKAPSAPSSPLKRTVSTHDEAADDEAFATPRTLPKAPSAPSSPLKRTVSTPLARVPSTPHSQLARVPSTTHSHHLLCVDSESESATGEMDVAGTEPVIQYDSEGAADEKVDAARAVWLYVKCAIDEADGETLWVTGSLGRLGAFDESRAQRLRRARRSDPFRICLYPGHGEVIASEPLQYRLLVLGPQAGDADGALQPATHASAGAVRRRSALQSVQLAPGTATRIHDEWPGESPESTYLANALFRRVWCRRAKTAAPLPVAAGAVGAGADSVSVEFRVLCTTVPSECSLFVVGALPELGGNDELKAVRLSDAAFPLWLARVACAGGAWSADGVLAFSYRYFYAPVDAAGRPLLTVAAAAGGDGGGGGGDAIVARETGLPRRFAARRDAGSSEHRCAVVLSDGDFRCAPTLRSAVLAVSVASLRTQTSLGVGDLVDARQLVDWAAKCGIGAVSLFPVLDTSVSAACAAGDHDPFAAISGFAAHPLYLSVPSVVPPELPELLEECDVLRDELRGLAQLQAQVSGPAFDYELVLVRKLAMLREVFEETRDDVMRKREFQAFVRRTSDWLAPYALFCSLRDAHGTADFAQWPADVRRVTLDDVDRLTAPGSPLFDSVAFYCFLQFNLDAQLRELRRHAEQRGVALIGTVPVAVRNASADVWLAPALFVDQSAQAAYAPSPRAPLGRSLSDRGLAVPRWATLRGDGYSWLRKRLRHASSHFHGVQLAHPVDLVRAWRIDNVAQPASAAFGHFWPADPLTLADFDAAGLGGKHAALSAMTERGLFVRDVDRADAFHPRPAYHSLSAFSELAPGERVAVEVLARTYEQRNALEWRAAATERLPKVLDFSDMLVLADADKAHVPMPLRQALDALGVVLVREVERAVAPRGVEAARASYVGAVSSGGMERHSARSWWAAERVAAEHLYRSLGHAATEPLPVDLPRDVAVAMLATALGGNAAASLSPSPSRASGTDDAMLSIIALHDVLALLPDAVAAVPAARDRVFTLERNGTPSWRYCMPLTIEELIADDALAQQLRSLVVAAGRLPPSLKN
jgi:hypothetical protein